ncbi:MAG: insulinase family protein, partial [Acidimicrobiia bacterium]
LDEDSRRTDAPFFNPSHAANPYVTAQRTPGLAAFAEPADLEATEEALLTEVRRAQLHGFTAEELGRSVSEYLAQVDLNFESFASKQDEQFAAEYVAHFLSGFPIPAAEVNRDLSTRLLEEMTEQQVTATWQATMESTRPLVIVAGPESAEEQIPEHQSVLLIAEAADGAAPPPRDDTEVTADRLMTPPPPVEIVSRDGLGTLRPTVLELENGVRVAYVVSDIAVDTVSMLATSPGGWLLLPPEDAVEAQLIGTIVSESGVAGLDQVALDRFLAGKVVQVFTGVDEVSEIMVGGSESDDLETLFQLIYLYFTQPRADQPALDALMGEIRPLAVDREAIPFLALADQLQASRFDADPRYLPVPALADLESFDLARALELHRERFSDASDFVFTFAGDFEAEEFEGLAARYLGALPAGGEAETAGTGQPAPPDGVVFEVVDSGDGELGAVAFQFTQPVELTGEVRLTAPLLESVLNQRLTALLREELGATYSPFVTLTMQDDPVELFDVSVQVSGNPDGLQGIADALEADLADLAANGPTADEFAIAQEQTVRDYELIGNQFWLDVMTFYVLNPDEDPDELTHRIDDTLALTRSDVRSLARRVLLLDDYIRVDLVPKG